MDIQFTTKAQAALGASAAELNAMAAATLNAPADALTDGTSLTMAEGSLEVAQTSELSADAALLAAKRARYEQRRRDKHQAELRWPSIVRVEALAARLAAAESALTAAQAAMACMPTDADERTGEVRGVV